MPGYGPGIDGNIGHGRATMKTKFCHLHVHSCYSLLDGSIRIKDLVARAAEQNMPAVALTDHGAMYGAIEFYKEAKARGIKPIIGCEVYVAPRSRLAKQTGEEERSHHLILLAQNKEGYANLTRLVSAGFLEGFYYKPRIDKELLAQHSNGLIVLSACLAGEIPALILKGEREKARQVARWYKDVFPGRFFLELQDHGLKEQQEANRVLTELSRELDIPLVATNDVHYLEKKDARIQDILVCIGTQKTLDDPKRLRFPNDEFYFKSEQEMARLFPVEALENSIRIADMIDLEFQFGHTIIPHFDVPSGFSDTASYLRHLCYEGIKRRYSKLANEIKQRLEYELNIIHQMGFDDYFLIVWDFINYAKKHEIAVGPGRGSAAGSLAAYALGITDIDPLRYGLLFERFLNPERVSMPDIDTDFSDVRRDEVIEYVRNKYGTDKVAQIITFGTMAARLAVRDAGRVLGFSYTEVDRVAKLIPPGEDIKTALQTVPELGLLARDPRMAELIEAAKGIEGLPRHVSTHAAGVIIAAEPLVNYTPLQKSEGVVITQYPMETLEELGLLKMDFLGLKTLTLIERTMQTAGISEIPDNDPDAFRLLAEGDTSGVFQLESEGMRSVLKELKPEKIEDVIAVAALYRPGPMEQIPTFIRNKTQVNSITYIHPDLEPILKETYGVIVYQEQIMLLAAKMAGYTLGQADILRRAIGKKKKEVLEAQKASFISGVAQKYSRELGEKLFDLIEKFASYGFNKSHATAYAVIAYRTAYLKAHYPREFMAALMSQTAGNAEKIAAYISECRQKGIPVLPPDINESGHDFQAVGEGIRFGLDGIKNVGSNAVDEVIRARAKGRFQSLQDFLERIDLGTCNREVLEGLILCGAMSSFGKSRAELLNILERTMLAVQQKQKNQNSGQLSLITMLPELKVEYPEPALPEFNWADVLELEKELLGTYVSGHPLDPYEERLKKLAWTTTIHEIREKEPEGKAVLLAGVVNTAKVIQTRTKETMCFVTLEDKTGVVEVVVFPRLYRESCGYLQPSTVVLVQGEYRDGKVIAEKIMSLPGKRLIVTLQVKEQEERLKKILRSFAGSTPVVVRNGQEMHVLHPSYWINDDAFLAKSIERIPGVNALEKEAI